MMALVFLVYMGRLFSIQVLSLEYAKKADSYVIRTKPIMAPRGNIYNRKGEIFVSNRPMFTMMVTPEELFIPDTLPLREILDMTQEEVDEILDKILKGPRFKEAVFARYIKPEVYGALQEQLWNFEGISFQANNQRYYDQEVGGHVLGYISEVNAREIEQATGKYQQGDLIGKSGIERSHDSTLRGVRGLKKVLKDVRNREVGPYEGGLHDQPTEKGKDIMLGLDTKLQGLGETLMEGKKGSIVAIEPRSGEILAFISAPAYQPSKLTGKELYENWLDLRRDTLNPLFVRPLMAQYPPGSIFKIPVALAALNEGVITPDTYYRCGGGFWRNKGKPGCRLHVTPLAFGTAVKHSCNSYFAATFTDFLHNAKYQGGIYEAYEIWYDYMAKMGIGQILDIDMPYEKAGQLPAAAMYDNKERWYGHNRWSATTIISNSIGQGEILMTPLQMANLVAIVANRGVYTPPHLLLATRDKRERPWLKVRYETVQTGIERRHYETVVDAMEQVVSAGTAQRARLEGIAVCGKTGTVENSGEDHSVFIGFAPKENPKIAIAVIIENAGGGGRWAAPAAAIMMEQYIRNEVKEKLFEYNRIRQATFKY
ncbi:MAG: penicillin-binding transpeptidase domain-containing protein [Bacteroidota bacterium]